MQKTLKFHCWLPTLLLAFFAIQAQAQVVAVVGHASLKKLDAATVGKIYTGRIADVDGVYVTAVNAPIGTDVRNKFLQACLRSGEVKYTNFWTVRNKSGFGSSIKVIGRTDELLRYIATTPGAIGYVDDSEVVSGANVLLRCDMAQARSSLERLLDLVVSQVEKLVW